MVKKVEIDTRPLDRPGPEEELDQDTPPFVTEEAERVFRRLKTWVDNRKREENQLMNFSPQKLSDAAKENLKKSWDRLYVGKRQAQDSSRIETTTSLTYREDFEKAGWLEGTGLDDEKAWFRHPETGEVREAEPTPIEKIGCHIHGGSVLDCDHLDHPLPRMPLGLRIGMWWRRWKRRLLG
jgi:hypothetical protein